MPLSKNLPTRHPTHRLESLSREKFRALFPPSLFLVRDDAAPDYGVDLSIEALVGNGSSPTNIRCFVQLKATNRGPASDGSHRINIKASNIHYLTNSHSSFYVLYSAVDDRFYSRSALDVFEELESYGVPNKKFLSVKFSEPLDKARVQQIHAQMINFAEAVREAERLFANRDYGEIIFGKYEDHSDPVNIVGIHAYRVDEFGNYITMEHEIWTLHGGKVPSGFEVFHKNGLTLDNRDFNLGLRPIETRRFRLGIFPTIEDNIGARNIFEVMVHGKKAVLEVGQTPEPRLFWRVIRELQDQGLSMMQEDVEAYKTRCVKYLDMDLRPAPKSTRAKR